MIPAQQQWPRTITSNISYKTTNQIPGHDIRSNPDLIWLLWIYLKSSHNERVYILRIQLRTFASEFYQIKLYTMLRQHKHIVKLFLNYLPCTRHISPESSQTRYRDHSEGWQPVSSTCNDTSYVGLTVPSQLKSRISFTSFGMSFLACLSTYCTS